MDRGRNAGITGYVDLQGTPAFTVRVLRYGIELEAGPLTRTKRGDVWRRIRQVTPGGRLILRGKVQQAGFPVAASLRDAVGTIKVQYNAAIGATLAVRIVSAKFDYDAGNGDTWDVSLVAEVTGNPAFTGFAGTQQTPAPAAYNYAVTHEGIVKGVDPDALQDTDQRNYDLEGLADDDATELAKIVEIVALATTRAGMKARRADFLRTDAFGGTVNVTYARTTTGEDVINEATSRTVDPQHVASVAVGAAINGTPATPTGDSFVARTTTTRELNDGAILTTVEFGLRDTKDDVEMDGTATGADVSSLVDQATITKLTSSSTPPTAPAAPLGQVVRTQSVQRNRLVWAHTFTYANTTPQQSREFEGTQDAPDPSSLQDENVQTFVTASSTPPAAPLVSGLVLRRRVSRQIGGTPAKWEHRFELGRRTTQDDVEMEESASYDDNSDLEGEATVTRVTASGTPAAAPASPTADAVHVGTRTRQIHATRWRHTYVYAPRTTQLAIEYDGSPTTTDAGGIDDRVVVRKVMSTATPSAPAAPTGLVLAESLIVQRTGGKWIHTYSYARVTTAQRLENANTSTTTDPNGLESRSRVCKTFDPTGSPPTNTTPTGFKLVETADEPINPNKSARTWTYAKVDSVDRLILPRTVTLADPSNIASRGTVAGFNVQPAVPPGYKSRGTRGFFQNGTDILYETEIGLNSHADDVRYAETEAIADAFEGVQYHDASVLPSSAAETAYQIAASLYNTYKASPTFEGLRVRKLNDNEAVVVLITRDDQVIVRYRFWGTGRQLVPAYFDGSDVYVFLRQKVKAGTGLWRMELAEQYRRGARGEFTVERRISGTSVNLNESRMNTSNGAAFLGLGIGKVAYSGIAAGASNISVPAPRTSRIVYGFEADSNGFVDLGSGSMGWQFTTADLSGRAEFSWQKASNLGLTSVVLAGADYSGFIS